MYKSNLIESVNSLLKSSKNISSDKVFAHFETNNCDEIIITLFKYFSDVLDDYKGKNDYDNLNKVIDIMFSLIETSSEINRKRIKRKIKNSIEKISVIAEKRIETEDFNHLIEK